MSILVRQFIGVIILVMAVGLFASCGWLDIALVQTLSAEKPEGFTYSDLMTFLESDQTDTIPYSKPDFVCGHFKDTLMANAEQAGIECGGVCVLFDDGGCHAINAFETVDMGIVFVDCSVGHDALVRLEVGKPYMYSYSTDGGVAGVVWKSIVSNYRVSWGQDIWNYEWEIPYE